MILFHGLLGPGYDPVRLVRVTEEGFYARIWTNDSEWMDHYIPGCPPYTPIWENGDSCQLGWKLLCQAIGKELKIILTKYEWAVLADDSSRGYGIGDTPYDAMADAWRRNKPPHSVWCAVFKNMTKLTDE